jgi:hypothetical protein
MRKLRVVTVTNNLEEYPWNREDTEEFPYLVDYVEDEIGLFVVDEDGGFWEASEFFHCTNITHFIIDSSESPE